VDLSENKRKIKTETKIFDPIEFVFFRIHLKSALKILISFVRLISILIQWMFWVYLLIYLSKGNFNL